MTSMENLFSGSFEIAKVKLKIPENISSIIISGIYEFFRIFSC
jgi:hypothetical protein